MEKQPELTVIMPVYNMERYLAKALEHLANQDDPNFKLLIVNDGSTDQTAAIAEKFRPRFRYLKIINKPNGGLSSARNVGMAHVETPYFTFHDGDDWVDPAYTDFFVTAFHQHPEAAMVSCGYYIDSPRRHNHVVGHKQAGSLSKGKTYLKMTNIFASPVKGYTWNKGYKTSVVRKYGLQFVGGLAFMEDQIFNVKYIGLTNGFYYSSRPLYHYWQRDDSMVHNFSLKMLPDNVKANYLVWHEIVKSLHQEHRAKKADQKEKRLISASEGNNNERKG
jgi:glycosyltransferase involved in cell wall biosynthesis